MDMTLSIIFREDVFKKRLDVEVGGSQVMKSATQSPEDVSFTFGFSFCFSF